MTDVAGSWLERAKWQAVLFAEVPRRIDLLRLEPTWECVPFRLRVHRNHTFEHVASALGPFLAFGARRAEISYSDYDDSLAFQLEGRADVELVWLDLERYRERLDPAALVSWLAERVADLRSRTDAPILVAEDPGADAAAKAINEGLAALAARVAGTRMVPLSRIGAELGPRTFDRRAVKLTGTPLSDAACVRAARQLGLVSLPAALAPRLKAVVVDLDHTLYAGVLGEDGAEGLQFSPAHRLLQERLLELRESGVFLAVASRNEARDVDELFAKRTDFVLRPEHLSARSIAFRDKPAGLREIAAALRIAPDAMLFVDDNPGEIARVAAELPGIQVLHAADPAVAARALALYPGLHGFPEGRDDARRVADLAAAADREKLAESSQDPEDYLRSLQVVLTLAVNQEGQLARMAELSGKTNQFNTTFLRLSEAQVSRRLADPACRTVTVALRDRLSDSGIVGVFFLRREEGSLVVDEAVVSCRALGRGIEQVMVTAVLQAVLADLPAPDVRFTFREGPRNGPAREFLAAYAQHPMSGDGVSLPWDEAGARAMLTRVPVTIEREERV